MLDNQIEMSRLIDFIERERFSICLAFADCHSEEVGEMLYDACALSLTNSVRELFQTRFTAAEQKAIQQKIGNESEVVELIIDEAGISQCEHGLEEILETIEGLSVFLVTKNVQVTKVL